MRQMEISESQAFGPRVDEWKGFPARIEHKATLVTSDSDFRKLGQLSGRLAEGLTWN
jgi:hypothetical protein